MSTGGEALHQPASWQDTDERKPPDQIAAKRSWLEKSEMDETFARLFAKRHHMMMQSARVGEGAA